jgi:hypothetical protein
MSSYRRLDTQSAKMRVSDMLRLLDPCQVVVTLDLPL